MKIYTAICYFLLCTLVWAEAPNKPEEKTTLPELKEIVVSGPYCGIYAFVAILDTFDIQPNIEELLVPEYVGSFQGSSNLELIKAAEKYKTGTQSPLSGSRNNSVSRQLFLSFPF